MRQFFILFLVLSFSVISHGQNVGQKGEDTLINYKDINGLKQGKWIKEYYNGQVRYKGYFVDDKPKGTFKRYDKKGNLAVEQYFYGDSLQCTSVMYYPNGDTLSVGKFYNKKKDSVWSYYNEKGIKTMIESFKRGVYHGDFIYYYPDGTKWQFIHYTNGEKDGTWKRFYKNGQPIFEAYYEDGIRQDTFRTYYENGQPEIIVPYVDDLKHGTYLLYDEKGKILIRRKYVRGVAENQEQLNRQETREVDSLLRNRGRFEEPYDEGTGFFREDRY